MSQRTAIEDPPEHFISTVVQLPVNRPSQEDSEALANRKDDLHLQPTRPLTPKDMPSEPWRPEYDTYRLRVEDGAIFMQGFDGFIGLLDGNGGVGWVRA